MIIAKGLTKQASEELKEITSNNDVIKIHDEECLVEFFIYSIDELLKRRWALNKF